VTTSGALAGRARVVIIGGGVGGASIAYHLAELGETDVVLVERDELTSGSTFHSAGLVGQLRADPTLTRMNMYSVALYRRLQQGPTAPGWVESGGIKLASSPERLAEIRRQISWARTFDLPLHEISVREAKQLFPLLDTTGVVGAAYLASDGHVDPAQLCQALAAGARSQGIRIHPHTRVVGIDVHAGRVTGVRTDRGDIECEVVVDCGGIFAAEIARLAGVRVPVVPMSHQYLVTEGLLPTAHALPSLRDPDLLVYFRQEGDGLLMGGYERQARPWTASSTAYDEIPADFNGRLLTADWPRFEQIAENSTVRVPEMAEVGIRTVINGPEAFTPDNEFCLGETEVAGFFVAAGFCAHGIAGAGGIGQVMARWVVDGEPGADLWHMDITRFGPAYRSAAYTLDRAVQSYEHYYDISYPHQQRSAGRPLLVSPVYDWHAERGAVFSEKAGWERVDYYEPHAALGDETLRPNGWAGRHWSAAIGVEHAATRNAAGLFDESSFAKIAVRGPDAAAFLDWVCDNVVARGLGEVTYTQLLNRRGGIEADLTVTRCADSEYLVVTGTASGSHDMAWLRKQARAREARVELSDVTAELVCFALWGPQARQILARLTPADLAPSAFRFMTAQQITVAGCAVRALQVSFVGEGGWELYAALADGADLWAALMDAGADRGLLACGYRALDSLRLEKGYRAWGTDIGPETNPYQAGLAFCVKWNKPGGFLGAAALSEVRERGIDRQLSAMALDDARQVVLGAEPVRVGGRVAGRVTSGGFGYTVGQSLAYAYLPVQFAQPDTVIEVDLFGEWVGGRVVDVTALSAATSAARSPR
jgi:4-methylaminobutanoate oxidase (formaldehyde-forming)